VWGRGDACTGFRWENLKERNHFVDPDLDGKIILRRILGKLDVGVWTGLSRLRIGAGGRYLCMR
jgi:hypothetical protein